MSMKEVMQIVDSQAAAGSGDFSRVALERSSVTYIRRGRITLPFIFGKFIVPEDGIYKISCKSSLSTVNPAESVYIRLELGGFGVLPSYTSYCDSSDRIKHSIKFEEDVKPYFECIVGEGQRASFLYDYGDIFVYEKSSGEVTAVMYKWLKKGEPLAFAGELTNGPNDDSVATGIIRDFKVTY